MTDKLNMTSSQKGNITEVETKLAFMKMGYSVLTPYGDCDRYDYVVDNDGIFYRMQCKTAIPYDGGFYIKCRSDVVNSGRYVSKTYTEDEIDYFVTYYNNIVYLIPVNKARISAIKLRITPTKTGQCARINWAKNFEMEEVVRTWKKKE